MTSAPSEVDCRLWGQRSPGAFRVAEGMGKLPPLVSESQPLSTNTRSPLLVWHGCNSLRRKARPARSHSHWEHGTTLAASVLLMRRVPRRNREGPMSFIFMIMAVPFLSATGIYNPQVMHHGHWIAEPGSFDALYCSASAEAAPHYRKYRAR